MANVHFLNYGGAAGFGGAHAQANTVFAPGKRKRINIMGICTNIFAPAAMFCSLYIIMSFKFHYQNPEICWLIALVYLGICIIVGMRAYRIKSRDRQPYWLTFTAGALFVALLTSVIFGNLNYRYNLMPFYEIQALNSYPSVDPAKDYGQQYMDAGTIFFADGTNLDITMASSFMSTDLYCVAPIVSGNDKLDHYDFWAVGTDCCSGVSPDFRCGQFNNPEARSGLRLVSESERPYYRLAVQVAEAQFNIQSPHPIFVEWLVDPLAKLKELEKKGWRYFLFGVCCHFSINLFAVMSATVLFSKIGYLANEIIH
jgi:hypothetical protein